MSVAADRTAVLNAQSAVADPKTRISQLVDVQRNAFNAAGHVSWRHH